MPTMEASARVLVVEDHADSREMLAEMLGLEGHQVTAVATGAEAVQIAETSHFDVAIVDIGLRGMNGHDAALSAPFVLLISIDGFADFYWRDPRVKAPTLRALAERGTVAEGVTAV